MFLKKNNSLAFFRSFCLLADRRLALTGLSAAPLGFPCHELSDEFFFKLEQYGKLLEMWNKRFNLTRIFRSPELFHESFYLIPAGYASLLADTLSHQTAEKSNSKPTALSVWDIGSGNGIPVIFCALLFSELHFSLCERDLKKSIFLKEVIRQSEIQNVDVYDFDLESVVARVKSQDLLPADVVLFRHVSHDARFLSLVTQLLEEKGEFFFQAGNDPFYKDEAYKKFLTTYSVSRYKIEGNEEVGFLRFFSCST